MAYWEQVGRYLQLGGVRGEIYFWYPLIPAINNAERFFLMFPDARCKVRFLLLETNQLGFRVAGYTGSRASLSCLEYNRERIKKRTPMGISSEKLEPLPGTTSTVSWVCFQYSNWSFEM
jgi:hypothetical protein